MNTDKYEGHTEGPWTIAWWEGTWYVDDENNGTVCELFGTAQKQDPTAKLIQDAPLLLAEVKRLREENTRLKNGDNWNAVVLDMADMISDSCMSKARFDAARYYCHKGECRTDWNDGLCPICEDGEEE